MLTLGLLAVASLLTGEAAAQKRVALVIGNSDYVNVRPLANPANDARAIAALFRAANFDMVEASNNLGGIEMRRVFRDFAEKARGADVAVVYYAGHGIEFDGTNYLLPIDTALKRDLDVEDEAISLDRVVRTLEPAKRLRLIILDACRDNPFVRTVRRTSETRSIGRGLAKVEPMSSDTLIAYAAKAGSTAADGDGQHSPFTVALLKNLTTPGLDLRIALGRVRDDVMEATKSQQEPFVYGSLGGSTVSLLPEVKTAAPAAVVTPPLPSTVDSRADIRRDYELALQVGTKEIWDAFLAQHGSGFYADLARGQRAKLLAEETRLATARTAPAAPPPTPAPATPTPAAPPAAAAPAATSVAALSPPASSESVRSIPDPADTNRRMLAELQRLGCYEGSLDVPWGQGSRRAVEQFNKHASEKVDTRVASLDGLSVMRAKNGRICPLDCKHGFRAENDACVKIVCGGGMVLGKSNECEREREKPKKSVSRPSEREASDSAPSRRSSGGGGGGSPAQVVCGMNGCLNVNRGCKGEVRPSGRGEVAVVLCGN